MPRKKISKPFNLDKEVSDYNPSRSPSKKKSRNAELRSLRQRLEHRQKILDKYLKDEKKNKCWASWFRASVIKMYQKEIAKINKRIFELKRT